MNSVCFTNSNIGHIAGDYGTILITLNGGGTLSVEEAKLNFSKYILYPNPGKDKITITNSSQGQEDIIIGVFNIDGEKLIENKFQGQNEIELDISRLASGIYIVRIQGKTGMEIRKLAVQ